MTQRVVVTGLGCISAAGFNTDNFADKLFLPEHQAAQTISPLSAFTDEAARAHFAAIVPDYNPQTHFSKSQLKQLDRFAQFALLATDEALAHAQLTTDNIIPQRTAVIHGTSIGGQETIENSYLQLLQEGKARAHPFTVPKLLPSSATSQISMKYGITGPSFSTSSACSSSAHAIAMAVLMLRSGLVDTAIAGGAEACITEGNFRVWEGLRVLSTDTCRPFSASRTGLIIGEGAGTLILETLEHALARSAPIHAELVGIGMSSDAHNIVQPLAEGAQQAMQAALDDANCSPDKIQYINAHGSGTVQNDSTETQAIKNLFQSHAQNLAISSTKSLHGHVLGAGGAIESIASIMAIKHQTVPPTRNYLAADSTCDLNYVPNHPVKKDIQYAMSNSFAFGGLNAALLFKKFS